MLETREVVPVGATHGVSLKLGVIAASHRDLRSAVADRRFRDDLYYRLARATVHLPALRTRKVDIIRLAQHEIAAVDRRLVAHAKLLEACALRTWPGNVRELRAAVREAAGVAIAAGRDSVRVEDLATTAGQPVGAMRPAAPPESPKAASTELDKDAIVAALARASGVVSVAARSLGLHRTQLYRLIDKHGLARDDT